MKFSEVIACTIALAKWGRTADGPNAAGTSDPTATPPSPRCEELRRFLLAQPPATIFLLTG